MKKGAFAAGSAAGAKVVDVSMDRFGTGGTK